MKRFIFLLVFLLITSLFISAITLSFAELSDQTVFSFKNNIHFGDTIETVKNKDDAVKESKVKGPFIYPYYLEANNVPLANSSVNLEYDFDENLQLKEILYSYTNTTLYGNLPVADVTSLYEILYDALVKKYGVELEKKDIQRNTMMGPSASPYITEETKLIVSSDIQYDFLRVEHDAWLLEYDDCYVKIDLGYRIRDDGWAGVFLDYYYLTKQEYEVLDSPVNNNDI